MQTNFFTQISDFLDGLDINLNLTMINGEITLSMLPKPKCDEPSKKMIRPLSIKATPEALDKAFFDAINKPLVKTQSWSKVMIAFEADMLKAEAESQKAKKQKKEQEALLKKVEAKATKASELLDTDPKKALSVINEGLTIDRNSIKLKELKQQANQKLGRGTELFQ